MSGKYGFGGGLDLPKVEATPRRAPLDQSALSEAVQAGKSLGFVDRDPSSTAKRKPGPKRTEVQDKISIPGPKRVIGQFRAFCSEQNVTLWEGLELLLECEKGRGWTQTCELGHLATAPADSATSGKAKDDELPF